MNLSDLGKTPISTEAPAGVDVKYDPDFDALQQEIDKLSSATAGGGIDWKKVTRMAGEILVGKSKDLQVGSYLAVALMQTEGLEGLARGATVLADLVENYWETLFPPKKRMRGRLNAITWWMDRAESFFKELTTPPLPAERIDNLRQVLSNLDQALSSRTEEAPLVSRLVDYVNRLPVESLSAPPSEPPAPTQPESRAAAPAAPKPATAPSQAPVAPIAPPAAAQTSGDAEQLVQAGLGYLAQAADFMFRADQAQPLPYRLNRLAAWLAVDRLPLADGGRTMLPPPDSMIRSIIENLLQARDYPSVIQAAESRVGDFLFWLDLSRFTGQALGELGGRYREAAETVALETALYVRRLPGLEQLSFSDGTPFADRETRAWLRANAPEGDQQPSPTGGGDSPAAEMTEALLQARGLVKDKKLFEAVEMIQNRLVRGSSDRERFQWRLVLARILIDAAGPELVRPHLDDIMAQMEIHHLDQWAPELATEALATVYEGLAGLDDDDARTLARGAMAKLARVAPAVALRLLRT